MAKFPISELLHHITSGRDKTTTIRMKNSQRVGELLNFWVIFEDWIKIWICTYNFFQFHGQKLKKKQLQKYNSLFHPISLLTKTHFRNSAAKVEGFIEQYVAIYAFYHHHVLSSHEFPYVFLPQFKAIQDYSAPSTATSKIILNILETQRLFWIPKNITWPIWWRQNCKIPKNT